jgi:hypothetical protein
MWAQRFNRGSDARGVPTTSNRNNNRVEIPKLLDEF